MYSFGATSSQGRRAVNQDCAGCYLARCGEERIAFLIVCDGMGGLDCGETASGKVLSAFEAWLHRDPPQLSGNPNRIELARQQWETLLAQENSALRLAARERGIQMGTAMAALLLWEDDYLLVNVGDVRGYVLRDALKQLTVDQTYISQEVAAGRLSREQARHDPNRNILLQCIGVAESAAPVFSTGKVMDGDAYLLCSDGLAHEIWDAEIESLLSEHGPAVAGDVLQAGLEELVRRARQRGETDDITAVAVRQGGGGKRPRPEGGWLKRVLRRKAQPVQQARPLQIEKTVRFPAD